MTLKSAPVAPSRQRDEEGQGLSHLEPSINTILSRLERNPQVDIVDEFEILFYIWESISKKGLTHKLKILSQMKRIFGSDDLGKVFFYLVEKKAFSAWDIQVHLDIPEASAYKHIKTLKSMDLLIPAIRANRNVKVWDPKWGSIKRGGPKPTIWQSQNAQGQDIVDALNRHYRSLSPKYRVAEKLAQTIITEITEKNREPEIEYSDIGKRIKEERLHRELNDVADLTAEYLHEQGIKVWR